jgi:hypothetical protein
MPDERGISDISRQRDIPEISFRLNLPKVSEQTLGPFGRFAARFREST